MWKFEAIPDEVWHSHTVQCWALGCIDPRFRERQQEFILKELAVPHHQLDFQPFPGGAKPFAEKNEAAVRALLQSLTVARTKHHAPLAMLMTHENCAAYGREFASFEEELAFHEEELRRAREHFKEFAADMQIRSFFVGRKKIIEIL